MSEFEALRAEGDQLDKKIASSRKSCADTTLKAAAAQIDAICSFVTGVPDT